jgi:hypothetical protein
MHDVLSPNQNYPEQITVHIENEITFHGLPAGRWRKLCRLLHASLLWARLRRKYNGSSSLGQLVFAQKPSHIGIKLLEVMRGASLRSRHGSTPELLVSDLLTHSATKCVRAMSMCPFPQEPER